MPRRAFFMARTIANLSWNEKVRFVDRYRWRIIVPLACALVMVYFHRVGTGVIADNLMRDFQISHASGLGMLSAIYFYTYAALQIPAGILADYYGPRRTVTAAAMVCGLGAIAFAMASSLEGLYIARFITSAGCALIYINIVKIYAEWFRAREFGTMCGISSFIGNAAVILATTPLALLVEEVGWRMSFGLAAVITCVVALFCWLIVRNSPELLGLPSIHDVEAREQGQSYTPNCMAAPRLKDSLWTVILNRHSWPPFLVGACIYGVFMAFVGIWGIPYFMQIYHMTRVEAATYMSTASFGYMILAPIIGYVSDRIKVRKCFFVVNTALMLGSWVVLAAWNGGKPPVWALYPLCFFIGVGTSGMTLNLPSAKEVNPVEMTGIATGMANAGSFVGAALVQPAFGWVLDWHWQGGIVDGVKQYPLEAFQNAFWLCCGVLVIALAASLVVKETKCQNIYHQIRC